MLGLRWDRCFASESCSEIDGLQDVRFPSDRAVLRAEALASQKLTAGLFNAITTSMLLKLQDLALGPDVVGIRIATTKCDEVLVHCCLRKRVAWMTRWANEREERRGKDSEHPASMELRFVGCRGNFFCHGGAAFGIFLYTCVQVGPGVATYGSNLARLPMHEGILDNTALLNCDGAPVVAPMQTVGHINNQAAVPLGRFFFFLDRAGRRTVWVWKQVAFLIACAIDNAALELFDQDTSKPHSEQPTGGTKTQNHVVLSSPRGPAGLIRGPVHGDLAVSRKDCCGTESSDSGRSQKKSYTSASASVTSARQKCCSTLCRCAKPSLTTPP